MLTLEYLCIICLIYNKMHDNHGLMFFSLGCLFFFLSETARPNSCSAVSHEAGEGELCDLTEGLFAAHRLRKVKETDSSQLWGKLVAG